MSKYQADEYSSRKDRALCAPTRRMASLLLNWYVKFVAMPKTIAKGSKISELGLEDDALFTSTSAPSAQSRYVYFPDHLVEMPGSHMGAFQIASTLFTEPIFSGALWSMLREFTQPPRSNNVEDESVGSFISRRFGTDIANKMVSAIFHGIYAGDIWDLSAEALLPSAWAAEKMEGSLMKARNFVRYSYDGKDLKTLFEVYGDLPMSKDFYRCLQWSSFYTFRNGLQQIVDRLAERLQEDPNVEIVTEREVTDVACVESTIDQRPAKRMKLTFASNKVSVELPYANKHSQYSTLRASADFSMSSRPENNLNLLLIKALIK